MNITKELKIRSFLGVPIFKQDGSLFGTLCCFDTNLYSFTEEDVSLLQTLSTFFTYVIELESSKNKIEVDLDRLSQKSDLILNSLSEGVFGLDIDGNISFVNEASTNLLKYGCNELIGNHPIHTFLNGQKDSELFLTLIDGKTRAVSTERFYSGVGNSFPVEFHTNAIYEKNQIVGQVVTFTDITERKNSENMILKSEKLNMAGQLAAGIAHEIRNPLTSIKGFLHLIKDGHQQDAYIQIMSEELIRIESIVSEFLLLAKPQDVNYKPEMMNEILTDVISILDTQAILSNTKITVSLDSESHLVNCDRNQMKQVFINLIKNSIEALPEGGLIDVTTKESQHAIEISVKDNGVGIPKDKLESLGQPFYSTKEEGTGLGLMVSFNIIQSHQGAIKVESVNGEGTTFTITLPKYEQPEYALM